MAVDMNLWKMFTCTGYDIWEAQVHACSHGDSEVSDIMTPPLAVTSGWLYKPPVSHILAIATSPEITADRQPGRLSPIQQFSKSFREQPQQQRYNLPLLTTRHVLYITAITVFISRYQPPHPHFVLDIYVQLLQSS